MPKLCSEVEREGGRGGRVLERERSTRVGGVVGEREGRGKRANSLD